MIQETLGTYHKNEADEKETLSDIYQGMNSLTSSQPVHTLLSKDDLQYKQKSKLKPVRNPLVLSKGTESSK